MEDSHITTLWGPLPHINMNQPQAHMCAPPPTPPHPTHPEPLSYLPLHPITLDCPRALALSAMLHASNLHWSSVLHIVIYMLQCSCLISSQPLLLPHSLIVCSLCLCLFCCLAYGIIITIFINSIYMH